MNAITTLTDAHVRQLSPEEFKKRLAELDDEFAQVNKEVLTPLALAIKQMKANCRHINSELRPYARFCLDCGEYYKVNTDFSPEVEKWFAEQKSKL